VRTQFSAKLLTFFSYEETWAPPLESRLQGSQSNHRGQTLCPPCSCARPWGGSRIALCACETPIGELFRSTYDDGIQAVGGLIAGAFKAWLSSF
jgi:hypothetical protein